MELVKYPGLKAEIARNGDTNKILAELLNLSESSISRRLSGEIDWTIGEIEILCDHYGKDAYELNLIKG